MPVHQSRPPPRPKKFGRTKPPKVLKNGVTVLDAPLTFVEMRWIEQYIIDLDPEASAHRAGVEPAQAKAWLADRRVLSAIQVLTSSKMHRNNIYADDMLRRWMRLMDADPRELIELRRVNCRHCYGHDNQYQFTKNELRQAQQAHRELMLKMPDNKRVPFDDKGGDGYDRNRPPSPDCTECFGDGIEHIHIHDTRTYSPSAAALYEGVEITKDGKMRIAMRNRENAEKMVAQHLGMFVQRNVNLNLDPTQLNDDQLNDAIAQFRSLLAPAGPYGGDSPPLLEHSGAGEEPSQDG